MVERGGAERGGCREEGVERGGCREGRVQRGVRLGTYLFYLLQVVVKVSEVEKVLLSLIVTEG